MPYILAVRALSGCGTVCSYFDIRRKIVINVLNKKNIDFSSVGFLLELLESYLKQRINLLLYCYSQNKVDTLKIKYRRRRGSIVMQRVNRVLLNWKVCLQLVTYLPSHFHFIHFIHFVIHFHVIHFADHSPSHSYSPHLVLLILHHISTSLYLSFFKTSLVSRN